MSESLEQLIKLCSDVTNNSKEVKKGSLFIALPGSKHDGRDYISEAIKKGASAIIYEKKNFIYNSKVKVPVIGIDNLYEQQAKILNIFYNDAPKTFKVIGVTGTNGKTSVAGWLSQCLNQLKYKTGSIGTLGYVVPGKNYKTSNTTPDIITLHKILNNAKKDECKFVVMEVSSHAIDQNRIRNIEFDAKILTNVTRDHLDYHKTIKKYHDTKKRFFSDVQKKKIILNLDDSVGREILKEIDSKSKIITYAINRKADLKANKIVYKNNKMNFDILWQKNTYQVNVNIFGKYNVHNILSVIATLLMYEFPIMKIINAIEKLQNISGRNEVVHFDKNGHPQVIIDYAHTPDALKNILKSLGEISLREIILIFGCGGNRDKGKREQMALIANKYAQKVIITNDNPRDEDPRNILDEIEKFLVVHYEVIEDRNDAIKRGLKLLKSGSILLIAGKGHENFQEIKGVKKLFSDKNVVISNKGLIKH